LTDKLSNLVLKYEKHIFILLLILHLAPVWSSRYFPSQDGPAHLNNAKIICEYDRPEREILRRYFILDYDWKPNLMGHFMLAGLMLFLPVLLSEKLLLTLYVIFLPLSIRYTLRAVQKDSGFISLLSFPFVFNMLLHKGFYNFILSLIIFFFILGFWVKNHNSLGPFRTLALSFLFLLLYFFHPVSLVMSYVAIVIIGLWFAYRETVQKESGETFDIGTLLKAAGSKIFIPILAILPSFLLLARFILQNRFDYTCYRTFATLGRDAVVLGSLVSFEIVEVLFSAAVQAVLFYLFLTKASRRKLEKLDAFIILTVVYWVIYFLAPDCLGKGSNLNSRLNLFPSFVFLLWLGGNSFNLKEKCRVVLASMIISFAALGFRMAKYAELNSYIEEYVSGISHIETGRTFLPLCFSQKGRTAEGDPVSLRIGLFLQTGGYIAAMQGAVDLKNYEANAQYFPVMFRPELNPYVHMGRLRNDPPQADIEAYEAKTGAKVDYVLLWQLRPENMKYESTRSLLAHLAAGYDLIYTSPARNLVRLYRRKSLASKS